MSDELKTCPFCGNSAIIVEIGGGTAFRVKCRNILECGSETESFDTAEEATAAWNRRTQSDHSVADNKTAYDNHPLTLEELRGMGDNLVWVEDWHVEWYGESRVGLERASEALTLAAWRAPEHYGEWWLAYRHKPEEE